MPPFTAAGPRHGPLSAWPRKSGRTKNNGMESAAAVHSAAAELAFPADCDSLAHKAEFLRRKISDEKNCRIIV